RRHTSFSRDWSSDVCSSDLLAKIKNDKGFIAALDQSGGSTPKALKLYGVDETAWTDEKGMYDVVHAMRTRLITSPAFTGQRLIRSEERRVGKRGSVRWWRGA